MAQTFKFVKFDRWNCIAEITRYKTQDKNPAIRLYSDDENRELIAEATTVVSGQIIDDNHVLIKNWGENVGMLKALIEYRIVKDTGRFIKSAFVNAHLCELI